MRRIFGRRRKESGLPPGTLVYDGEEKASSSSVAVIDYDQSGVREKAVEDIQDCFPLRDSPSVSWINVDGLGDLELIESLGNHFGFHPLVLEDVVSTNQRPKFEEFEEYIFIVIKMLDYSEDKEEITSEQVSFLVGKNYVVSFQEHQGDLFEPIRQRIRNRKGRIVREGADYLAYALIDIIVDNYFNILEKTGDRLERMEELVMENPEPETLQEIRAVKREMIFLRRSAWPLREVITNMERVEPGIIRKSTGIYLRDVYDHVIQVVDTIETMRDMVSGLQDVYISSVSNRMNEVMKVLTIIATIFIPLTYVAGIYGMNFEHMPELHYRWAYPAVWAVMAVLAVVMLIFFKRKRWL
jgi:magnesium transporter